MPVLSSVNQLVKSLGLKGEITVERRPNRPTINRFGDVDQVPAQTITISPAAVHNTSGRDLDQVPEADRNSEGIEIYTKERLYVSDGGFQPDIVIYQGRRWRVVKVEDYDRQGAVYISTALLEELQQP